MHCMQLLNVHAAICIQEAVVLENISCHYHIYPKYSDTLMFSMLGKIFQQSIHGNILLIFPEKKGFDISCKLSGLHETSTPVFCEKNQKNIINLSSAESAQRVVTIKSLPILF